MKKIIFSVLIVASLVFTGCSGGGDVMPTATPKPASTEITSPAPTTDPILTVPEATALLRERFGEHSVISRMPDMERYENGLQLYGFSVDYSGIGHEIPADAYVYVWVNSVTGWMDFEESGLYANIPDNMFPVPMREGVVIPYDSFSPPGHESDIAIYYGFADEGVMELYKEQLRTAGFVDYGTVQSVESLWQYERSDTGATLIVEMYSGEERFSMNMYVNYLNGQSPTSESNNTFGTSSNNEDTEFNQVLIEYALTGNWHAAPGIPSGYAERFIFSVSHDFIYLKSEMDTTEPLLSYWGTWSAGEDDLELTITHKKMIVGGIVTEDETGEQALTGGVMEVVELSSPEIITLSLSQMKIDENHFTGEDGAAYPFTVKIGETEYWKFDYFDDVADY